MPLEWHGFQEKHFWHAPNQCNFLKRLAKYNCCDSGRRGPISQLNGGKSQAIVKLVPNGGTKSVGQMKRQADYLIRRTGDDPPHPGHPHRVDAKAERNRFGIKLTREQLHELLDGWHAAYQGNPKHDKTSHFAISFPIGTDPTAAAAAGEDFAHEIFGCGNYGDTWQYYVVHHNQGEHEPTDEIPHPHERPHPHTHVVAFRVGRNGKRLKVSKRSDLNYDELRNVAVSTARKHGIDMEASPRFVRGEAQRPPIQSELRRALAENRKPYRPANSPQDAFEFAMSVYLRAKQLSMEADALREDMPQIAEIYQNVSDHLRQGWPISRIDVPFEIVNQQKIEHVNKFLQGRRQLIMADFTELDQRIQNLPGNTEAQLKKRVATEREFSDLKVALAPFLSPAGEGDEDAHQYFMNAIVPDRRDPYRGVQLDAGRNDKVRTRLVLDTYNDISDLAQQQGLNGRLMKLRYASGNSVNPALAEKWRNEEIAELHSAHPNASPEILDDLHQNILQRLIAADWQLYVHTKTKQEIAQDALDNPGAAIQPVPNDPCQQTRVDRIRAVLTPQQIERLLPLPQYQQQLEEVTGQLANDQGKPTEVQQLTIQKRDIQMQVASRSAILTPITTNPEQQQRILDIYCNACNSLGISEIDKQQVHAAYPAQPENWPLSGKVGIWSEPGELGQGPDGMGGPDDPGSGIPGGALPPAGNIALDHHDADANHDSSHDQWNPAEQVMHADGDNDQTTQTDQEDPGQEAPSLLPEEIQGPANGEGNGPDTSSLQQPDTQHIGHDTHDMEEDKPGDDQNTPPTGDNDHDMQASQRGQAANSGGPQALAGTGAEGGAPSSLPSRRLRITEVEKLRKWSLKPIIPEDYARTRSATRQLRAARAAILARREAERVARLMQRSPETSTEARQTEQSGSGNYVPAPSSQPPQFQASRNTLGAGPSNASGALESERQNINRTNGLSGQKRPRPTAEGESGSDTIEPASKRTRPTSSGHQAQPQKLQAPGNTSGAGPGNTQTTREAERQKHQQTIGLSGQKRSRPPDLEDNGFETAEPPLKKGVFASSRQSSSRIKSASELHETSGSNRGQPSGRPSRSTPLATETNPADQYPGSAPVSGGENQNDRARAPAELSAMERRLTELLDRTPQASPSTNQQPAETGLTRRLGQTLESRYPAETRRTSQHVERERGSGNRENSSRGK